MTQKCLWYLLNVSVVAFKCTFNVQYSEQCTSYSAVVQWISCRSSMSTRRRYKHSSIPSPVRLLTTLSSSQPRLRRSASSVRVCCGVWLAKDYDVLNVDLRRTRNAKTCSTLTAFNVSSVLTHSHCTPIHLYITCTIHIIHHLYNFPSPHAAACCFYWSVKHFQVQIRFGSS